MSLQDTMNSDNETGGSNPESDDEQESESGFEHDDDRNEETNEAPPSKNRDPRQKRSKSLDTGQISLLESATK
jgi:hypothetical protein